MALVDDLTKVVGGLPRRRGRLVLAIDGPDAAGKTTLARGLVAHLPAAVLVSLDGWHRPRPLRQDYYRDSFDLDALVEGCLQPFVEGASRVRTACFDHVADAPVDVHADVPEKALLLVEGVFLLRPELRRWWDVSVYLHVPEDVTLARAAERDRALLGSEVRGRYEARYLPGQAHYREVTDPMAAADVVVDNSDPTQPEVLRWFGA